jgi:hypothetical protein
MQDLTPVGLSQDGRRLLLVSPAGEEFSVPVDPRLRAALRGENARLGQLEMKMESALRPRDIQARIRSGESPEDVAAAAQTSVEAIMGFATPVLAERAHVATTALKASVRRRSGESSSAGRTLGETAELFFSDHSLHEEDVEWDAWRRPDGRWALVAAYAVGGRPRTAEFTHDLPGRYVVAENDEARILTGEVSEPESRQPAGGRTAPSRRLSSVPSQDELPLGDDAIELVRNREPAADEATDPVAVPETAARAGADTGADTADADWIAERVAEPSSEPVEGSGGGTATPERAAGPGAEPVTRALPETAAHGQAEAQEKHQEDDPEDDHSSAGPAAATPAPAEEAAATATPPKKKSRSSVPSWDEIMFGGGKRE